MLAVRPGSMAPSLPSRTCKGGAVAKPIGKGSSVRQVLGLGGPTHQLGGSIFWTCGAPAAVVCGCDAARPPQTNPIRPARIKAPWRLRSILLCDAHSRIIARATGEWPPSRLLGNRLGGTRAAWRK